VDVDEGVQEADGEGERQRQDRPTPGRDDRGGNHCGKEQESDDPELAKELQRRRVRLDDGERRLPLEAVGEPERTGAGPVCGVVDERVPRLPPPTPAVARTGGRKAARSVRELRAARIVELVPAVAHE